MINNWLKRSFQRNFGFFAITEKLA